MRLVFPTDDNIGYLSKRGAHFGKAKFYTIITLEDNKIVDVDFDQVSTTVENSIEMFVSGKLEKSTGQGTCSTN